MLQSPLSARIENSGIASLHDVRSSFLGTPKRGSKTGAEEPDKIDDNPSPTDYDTSESPTKEAATMNETDNEHVGTANQLVDVKSSRVDDAFATKKDLEIVRSNLSEMIIRVSMPLSEKVSATREELTDKISALDDKLSDKISAVSKEVSSLRQETSDKISALDDKLSDKISAVIKEVSSLRQETSDKTTALDDKLSDRISALDDKLSDRISALDDKLSEKISALDDKIIPKRVIYVVTSIIFAGFCTVMGWFGFVLYHIASKIGVINFN